MARRSGEVEEVPDLTVMALVNGMAGVIYRRLRTDRVDELPKLAGPLVDWGFSYTRSETPAVVAAAAAAAEPSPGEATRPADDPRPGWDEPPDSDLSRKKLSQRDRIVRAAAQVVVAGGYASLSIPAISRTAGTSNQTFYEHFGGKREAFLAAFEMLAAKALMPALAAFSAAEDGPRAVGIGLRVMLEQIARDPIFARLAFFELPAAGPAVLDRADQVMDSVTAYLEPGLAPKGIGDPVPSAIREAIATGIWAVIQREIAQGRADSLPCLAPEITRLALMPGAASTQEDSVATRRASSGPT